jgi:putative heme-binding domain-containing protein
MRPVLTVLALTLATTPSIVRAQSRLHEELTAESPATLAETAREIGDAKRGAVLFYQPYMACRQCHAISGPSPLGPNLAELGEKKTDEHLIESVLKPSAKIEKKFLATAAVTNDGRVIAGLLEKDDPSGITIREGRPGGKVITIPRSDLDEVTPMKTSFMPDGQMNQLASRQQFFDLIRYLIEIRDGGPIRAKELEPAPALYQLRLPEYEKHIDHKGLMSSLDQNSFKRGEAIYNRLCINCHGNHDRPGSLPTSLRFASGKFRNGSDPYTMYQTLTRGFGMMVAQSWMVPSQKYDVIHYVREAYLKQHNPTQYFPVNDEYLDALPKGDTQGPAPRRMDLWATMDYGPSLINTYEVGNDASNFAYKGIAVRLDKGPGGIARGNAWMVFDHDTMRVSAAWTGKDFIDWNGIHFNGRHNIHPRVVGDIHLTNPTGPGYGRPASSVPSPPGGESARKAGEGGAGSFADTARIVGRDKRIYGPLPRKWAHYKGLYHYEDKTIISYTVGETSILEMPGLQTIKNESEGIDKPPGAPQHVFKRAFNIGPRSKELVLQIARGDIENAQLALLKSTSGQVAVYGTNLGVETKAAAVPAESVLNKKLEFSGATSVEIADASAFDMTSKDFTIAARVRTKSGGTIFCRTAKGPKWVPDGKSLFIRGGRLTYDIGWVGALTSNQRINDGKWHDVAMTWVAKTKQSTMFIDGKPAGAKVIAPKGNPQKHVVRLGFSAPNFPSETYLKGDLETVSFFQRALKGDEIAKAGDLSDKSLVARWKPSASNQVAVKDVSNQQGKGLDGVVFQGAPPATDSSSSTAALLAGVTPPIGEIIIQDGALRLVIPPGKEQLEATLWWTRTESGKAKELAANLVIENAAQDLSEFTRGGKPRWPERLSTVVGLSQEDGPYVVDVLSRPATNPWLAQVRLTGFDFYPDGDRLAICSWDGDVWLVSGLKQMQATVSRNAADAPKLTWQRIASGLFQPLGLKIIDEKIFLTCRDQICILHDLNGDGETDFYENFNNDAQVTDHFHEFAMGLQTDEEGNLYYAKSARHALTALVPHHGTLLRVSKDGSKTDILATGFRAANGVCLNPDGTFIVTDQEGHWNPKNRINYVKEGGFYGNMFGYHDVTDSSDEAMEQPLCWITNSFDRSPAELLWCEDDRWGPLSGSLLNLSYGYGKVFVVPHEKIGGQAQGGMCELPIPQAPTGLIRGRFNPNDGQLYACGMFAWAGSQNQPGGFYRIRYTGKPVHLPVGLEAKKDGMKVRFSGPLDEASAADVKNWRVKVWSLKRTRNYGSKHYDEKPLEVSSVEVDSDGQTVFLNIPKISPTWCMEIRYSIRSKDGKTIDGVVHNTVHQLGD